MSIITGTVRLLPALVLPVIAAGAMMLRSHLPVRVPPEPLKEIIAFHCSASEGQTLIAEFQVHNPRSSPIRLLGANISCGCTLAADEYPISVEANGMYVLHFRIKVGSPDLSGHFVRRVSILSNAAEICPELLFDAKINATLKD